MSAITDLASSMEGQDRSLVACIPIELGGPLVRGRQGCRLAARMKAARRGPARNAEGQESSMFPVAQVRPARGNAAGELPGPESQRIGEIAGGIQDMPNLSFILP